MYSLGEIHTKMLVKFQENPRSPQKKNEICRNVERCVKVWKNEKCEELKLTDFPILSHLALYSLNPKFLSGVPPPKVGNFILKTDSRVYVSHSSGTLVNSYLLIPGSPLIAAFSSTLTFKHRHVSKATPGILMNLRSLPKRYPIKSKFPLQWPPRPFLHSASYNSFLFNLEMD